MSAEGLVVCGTCGYHISAFGHAPSCPKVLRAGPPPPFCYDQVEYLGVRIAFDPTAEQMRNLVHHVWVRQEFARATVQEQWARQNIRSRDAMARLERDLGRNE
jgi:hypothetical protein